MARRTTEGTHDQWQRVADAVVERREFLGYTHDEITGDGLSKSVLSLIENNRQTKYATRGLQQLCRRLAWTSDSIDRLLAGQEPRPLEEALLDEEGKREYRRDTRSSDLEASVAQLYAFTVEVNKRLSDLARRVDAMDGGGASSDDGTTSLDELDTMLDEREGITPEAEADERSQPGDRSSGQ